MRGSKLAKPIWNIWLQQKCAPKNKYCYLGRGVPKKKKHAAFPDPEERHKFLTEGSPCESVVQLVLTNSRHGQVRFRANPCNQSCWIQKAGEEKPRTSFRREGSRVLVPLLPSQYSASVRIHLTRPPPSLSGSSFSSAS